MLTRSIFPTAEEMNIWIRSKRLDTIVDGIDYLIDVMVLKRTCEANQAGENSSFIFIVCVRSVPRYYFKLA